MRRLLPLLLLFLGGCAQEDRSGLTRRPLDPPRTAGWARLRLDAGAQAQSGSLWVGDAQGTPIPFLLERAELWTPRDLETRELLLGRNEAGHPTAEFGLKLPEGWRVREREHLTLDLDLLGEAPWTAQVKLERQLAGGAWLRVETPHPPFVYDLSDGHGKRSVTLPWDGDRFRISLEPTQGKAPALKGVKVRALTVPEALEVDEVLTLALRPLPEKAGLPGLEARLPRVDRVVGLDVEVAPPVAPVAVQVGWKPAPSPKEPSPGPEATWPILASGLVWNLPALRSQSTRLAFPPVLTEALFLRFPPGVVPTSVRALIRREALLFPAEAGQAYFLHLGGRPKAAPGNLGALPPSREVYGRAPLAMGAAEPDPQGLGRRIEGGERTRGWLPWAVGAAVLALLWMARSLFQPMGSGQN